MPDLSTQTARWCATNDTFETTIESDTVSKMGTRNRYTVSYGPQYPGPYARNWNCTCMAFAYFGRRRDREPSCKHIEQAKKLRCGYGWEAAAGSPANMGNDCPKCGGPTSVVEYAV